MENIKYETFYNEAKNLKKILKDYKRTGKPFVDQNFHPTKTIFEYENNLLLDKVTWKRVDELYDVPLFQKDLIDKDFVQQGYIGDCYFIAALSRIAKQPYLVPSLFETITYDHILGKQENTIDIKCGAVVVYFHCFGRRTPVLIDTLLPTIGSTLIYSQPPDNTKSPWFCLIEKAYAKLFGSYSGIVGGSISISFYHLFGYYPSLKQFSKFLSTEKVSKMPFFDRIMRYQRNGAAMGVSIHLDHNIYGVTEDEVNEKGLYTGHCYVLLKAREHNGKHFICLRNPHGEHEWNGDYSDSSPLWTPELKKALDWKLMDDGTFWMIEDDFIRFFTNIKMSRPILPQWFKRSFFVQLTPGDHDGYDPHSSLSKVTERPNYAFQITQPVEADQNYYFKVVIERVEKKYDEANKTPINSPAIYCFFIHNGGKKIIQMKLSIINIRTLMIFTKFQLLSMLLKEMMILLLSSFIVILNVIFLKIVMFQFSVNMILNFTILIHQIY